MPGGTATTMMRSSNIDNLDKEKKPGENLISTNLYILLYNVTCQAAHIVLPRRAAAKVPNFGKCYFEVFPLLTSTRSYQGKKKRHKIISFVDLKNGEMKNDTDIA